MTRNWNYSDNHSGITRRDLLRYGGGAIASGAIASGMATTGSAAPTQSASVDLGTIDHQIKHDSSGFLYGLSKDGTAPADKWLNPINSGLQVGGGARLEGGAWALGGVDGYYVRWNSVVDQYNRVTTSPNHAEYCVRMSDLWGADAATLDDTDPYPGDDGDWTSYNNFVDQILSDVVNDGLDQSKFHYEIWNEPDIDLFWPRPQSQYFEMWERGVNRIRANDSAARIVGPGHTEYDRAMMKEFLNMTIDTGTEPDIVNWHELQDDEDPLPNADDCRDLLNQLGISAKLMINEYVPNGNQDPGYTTWDIARIEKTDVEWAGLANWDYCCDTPALCHTLTEDGTQPNGRYWPLFRYGQLDGDVMTRTPSTDVDMVPNVNVDGNQARIVAGNKHFKGNVDITIKNVDTISSRIRVKVEQSIDAEPLEAPNIAQDYYTDVSGTDHTVTLDWKFSNDAFIITVTPAAGPIAEGTYTIENVNSGDVLTVENASTADGGNVVQEPDAGGSHQQWSLTNEGDSVYRIENVNSGKVLDVDGASTNNGANIWQWADENGDNQRWYVEATSQGGYRIEPTHSGKMAEVQGASTTDGANVQQWVERSESHQRWVFNAV